MPGRTARNPVTERSGNEGKAHRPHATAQRAELTGTGSPHGDTQSRATRLGVGCKLPGPTDTHRASARTCSPGGDSASAGSDLEPPPRMCSFGTEHRLRRGEHISASGTSGFVGFMVH